MLHKIALIFSSLGLPVIFSFTFLLYLLMTKTKREPRLVWRSGLGIVPQTERLQVQLPVMSHAWVADSVPSWGMYGKQPINVSLPFSPSSPLSKKKKMKMELNKWVSWVFKHGKYIWRIIKCGSCGLCLLVATFQGTKFCKCIVGGDELNLSLMMVF